jgi:quercetin dioxygenase-like cupin family protein
MVLLAKKGSLKMKLIKMSEGESYEPEKDWKRISLCNQSDISIEHFVKPPGHQSPKHNHPNAQVLVVLKGKIVVTGESEEKELSEGDTIYIPGDEMHVVKNPLNTVSIGIDIFVPGRSFDFWLNKLKGNK